MARWLGCRFPKSGRVKEQKYFAKKYTLICGNLLKLKLKRNSTIMWHLSMTTHSGLTLIFSLINQKSWHPTKPSMQCAKPNIIYRSKFFIQIEEKNICLESSNHISSLEEQSKNLPFMIPLSTIALQNVETIPLLNVFVHYSMLAVFQNYYGHMLCPMLSGW